MAKLFLDTSVKLTFKSYTAAWQRARRKEKEMNKAELAKDIRQVIGCSGTMSKGQLARYLNKTRNGELTEYLDGLPYIPDGRGKRYYVLDVAARILENTVQR